MSVRPDRIIIDLPSGATITIQGKGMKIEVEGPGGKRLDWEDAFLFTDDVSTIGMEEKITEAKASACGNRAKCSFSFTMGIPKEREKENHKRKAMA